MKGRSYLLSLMLSLIVAATVSGQTTNPANQSQVEKPVAPTFSLTSLQGEKFDLAAQRGQVVVLNFWFTRCGTRALGIQKMKREAHGIPGFK